MQIFPVQRQRVLLSVIDQRSFIDRKSAVRFHFRADGDRAGERVSALRQFIAPVRLICGNGDSIGRRASDQREIIDQIIVASRFVCEGEVDLCPSVSGNERTGFDLQSTAMDAAAVNNHRTAGGDFGIARHAAAGNIEFPLIMHSNIVCSTAALKDQTDIIIIISEEYSLIDRPIFNPYYPPGVVCNEIVQHPAIRNGKRAEFLHCDAICRTTGNVQPCAIIHFCIVRHTAAEHLQETALHYGIVCDAVFCNSNMGAFDRIVFKGFIGFADKFCITFTGIAAEIDRCMIHIFHNSTFFAVNVTIKEGVVDNARSAAAFDLEICFIVQKNTVRYAAAGDGHVAIIHRGAVRYAAAGDGHVAIIHHCAVRYAAAGDGHVAIIHHCAVRYAADFNIHGAIHRGVVCYAAAGDVHITAGHRGTVRYAAAGNVHIPVIIHRSAVRYATAFDVHGTPIIHSGVVCYAARGDVHGAIIHRGAVRYAAVFDVHVATRIIITC